MQDLVKVNDCLIASFGFLVVLLPSHDGPVRPVRLEVIKFTAVHLSVPAVLVVDSIKRPHQTSCIYNAVG